MLLSLLIDCVLLLVEGYVPAKDLDYQSEMQYPFVAFHSEEGQ